MVKMEHGTHHFSRKNIHDERRFHGEEFAFFCDTKSSYNFNFCEFWEYVGDAMTQKSLHDLFTINHPNVIPKTSKLTKSQNNPLKKKHPELRSRSSKHLLGEPGTGRLFQASGL